MSCAKRQPGVAAGDTGRWTYLAEGGLVFHEAAQVVGCARGYIARLTQCENSYASALQFSRTSPRHHVVHRTQQLLLLLNRLAGRREEAHEQGLLVHKATQDRPSSFHGLSNRRRREREHAPAARRTWSAEACLRGEQRPSGTHAVSAQKLGAGRSCARRTVVVDDDEALYHGARCVTRRENPWTERLSTCTDVRVTPCSTEHASACHPGSYFLPSLTPHRI